jgi:phosphoribosyl-ATP pyrophosphohydrolase/phosphoribosyl-AMP cyclohydrolase
MSTPHDAPLPDPIAPDRLVRDERGLMPAVVQDARTGEVLMLAWQNAEALARTLESGKATFFSRSRNALWTKGETSGNGQAVRALRTDCDADAVLLQVEPAGPACHTGARSCFFRAVSGAERLAPAAGPDSPAPAAAAAPAAGPGATLAALEAVLKARQAAPPPGSYTAKLFGDEALRHKKVGEEATELIVASLRGQKEEIVWEAADLVYHTLVLLRAHGLGMADVEEVLRTRENAPRRK